MYTVRFVYEGDLYEVESTSRYLAFDYAQIIARRYDLKTSVTWTDLNGEKRVKQFELEPEFRELRKAILSA